jgi:hypothetical protein
LFSPFFSGNVAIQPRLEGCNLPNGLCKVAIISAEKIGFSKATANRLLNNTLLFKKNGDLYERKIS